jgi:hypothetical protein
MCWQAYAHLIGWQYQLTSGVMRRNSHRLREEAPLTNGVRQPTFTDSMPSWQWRLLGGALQLPGLLNSNCMPDGIAWVKQLSEGVHPRFQAT